MLTEPPDVKSCAFGVKHGTSEVGVETTRQNRLYPVTGLKYL